MVILERLSFPVDIHLGRATIPVHLVCELFSYFVGYRYYSYLRRHSFDPISETNRLVIFCGAVFGAFLGAHIIGVIENPEKFRWSLVYFMANKTIVGGFLGGLIGVELIKKIIQVKVSSGDMMVYPIITGMVIGRIGCLLSGLKDGTYGNATTLPWGINFGDGVYRHPTNLYEIFFWILLGIALYLIEHKSTLANGARFKIMLSAYLVFRFFIEFIKPDYFFSFGASVIQLACLAGIVYYYKVFIFPRKLFIKSYA